jgi:hypothetical protein
VAPNQNPRPSVEHERKSKKAQTQAQPYVTEANKKTRSYSFKKKKPGHIPTRRIVTSLTGFGLPYRSAARTPPLASRCSNTAPRLAPRVRRPSPSQLGRPSPAQLSRASPGCSGARARGCRASRRRPHQRRRCDPRRRLASLPTLEVLFFVFSLCNCCVHEIVNPASKSLKTITLIPRSASLWRYNATGRCRCSS